MLHLFWGGTTGRRDTRRDGLYLFPVSFFRLVPPRCDERPHLTERSSGMTLNHTDHEETPVYTPAHRLLASSNRS